MPEEHKHPDYEQTFARVATILDVIAQEQEEQTRRGAETDARIDKFVEALQEYVAHSRERDDETTDKLNGLINLMDRHLREHGHQ